MIKPVGQGLSTAIDAAKLRDTTPAAMPASAAQAATVVQESGMTTPAARLAQQGAPLDMDKIARIKQAISSGNYPVDAEAIADRMVELDLPRPLN